MDEQKFVDTMDMGVLTMKMMGNRQDIDIPSEITESTRKCGSFPLLQDVLEIRSSSIHGKGVFAKKDIHPNQVVTLYPCHGVMIGKLGYCAKKHRGDYEKALFNPDDYKIKLRKGSDTFIYGNPYTQDESLVGHLINDSYKDVRDFKNIDKANIPKCVIRYLISSIKSNNCALVQCEEYVYVKTTKFIHKGEELLAPYGYGYWCSEMKINEVDLLMKEYILAHSETQQKYIYFLYKQIIHTSPAPSKEIQTLMHSDRSTLVAAMIEISRRQKNLD